MSTVASMTGYASADGATPAGNVTVECRSVNSRFLDLTLRLDESVRFAEPAVRQMLQKRLARGKVEVRISLKAGEDALPPCPSDRRAGHCRQCAKPLRL